MTKNCKIVLRLFTVLLFAGALFTRCANIMTPDGGPKDTLPPVIIKLQPDNFATNFKEKKIYIEFNEFVQIKDQNKEMFTSPAMKKQPLLTTRGKGIVITIRDTLKENTTYAIDLGSAIRDNNEGNPLNAMRFVFSTGDKVDSIMCSGYTADSYKADSVSRTFIWFYIADSLPNTPGYDSTIFNRKPDVIARAQNNGIFIAQNLKPVNYRIYAIGDKNDNQLYEPGTDMVGLLDTVYNPVKLPEFGIWFDSLRMYPSAEPQLYFRMFTDKAFVNQRLVDAQRPEQKKALLYFNADYPRIDSLIFDNIPSDKILIDQTLIDKGLVGEHSEVELWLGTRIHTQRVEPDGKLGQLHRVVEGVEQSHHIGTRLVELVIVLVAYGVDAIVYGLEVLSDEDTIVLRSSNHIGFAIEDGGVVARGLWQRIGNVEPYEGTTYRVSLVGVGCIARTHYRIDLIACREYKAHSVERVTLVVVADGRAEIDGVGGILLQGVA